MKLHEEIAPLLSAFVDGALTEAESAEVRAHLTECEACRARAAEYAAMREGLREAMEEVEVPADFTANVMAAVRAEKANAPRRRRARAWRGALPVAACAALVIFGAALFPGMHRMGNDSATADTAVRQEANVTASYAADAEDAAPSEAEDQELMQEQFDSVQGSAYYASVRSETTGSTAPESAVDGAPMPKNGGEGCDDGLVYTCEVREIGGEEGLLWVEQNGAVLLTLSGAGAVEYVEENGGVKDGDAGYYYLPVSALFALPESITLSDVQAAALAELPEEAEWVIVYPDDVSEGAQE